MNWKPRVLAVVLAACLMSALVGCEQKKKSDKPEAPPNTTDTP
jgi:hypothetical protein